MSRQKVFVGARAVNKAVTEVRRTSALLLDFDGTLADTIPLLFRGYMALLAERGVTGSREEFDRLNGLSMQEVMAALREAHELPNAMEELWLPYMGQLRALYAKRVELFEGTVPFLQRAVEAGLRLAIVTSATTDLVQSCLERHGVSSLISAVITPEGLARSKPDPAIYQKALEALGVPPHEALAVEDAPHGMHAAIAAGIPTVAMVRDESGKPLSGVLATVSTWDEILALALSR